MEFCSDAGKDCTYQLFGRWQERCIKCSVENPQVASWRRETVAIVRLNDMLGLRDHNRLRIPAHPYLQVQRGDTSPRWSFREYRKAARSRTFKPKRA